jgi:hypothetical protein
MMSLDAEPDGLSQAARKPPCITRSRRCADDIMTPNFPEDRFAWLNLVGNTMPPRDPNNGDDDEDDEDDEEDEDREPAVIREPDEDE